MKCNECGNEGTLEGVMINDKQRLLCKSCIAVLRDKCLKFEGFYCENCCETHQSFKWFKDSETGIEYMECELCGFKTEVESIDQTDLETQIELDELVDNITRAGKILEQIGRK